MFHAVIMMADGELVVLASATDWDVAYDQYCAAMGELTERELVQSKFRGVFATQALAEALAAVAQNADEI